MSYLKKMMLLVAISSAAVFSTASIAQDDTSAATPPADVAATAPTDAADGSSSAAAPATDGSAAAPMDSSTAEPAPDASSAQAAPTDAAAPAPADTTDASAAAPADGSAAATAPAASDASASAPDASAQAAPADASATGDSSGSDSSYAATDSAASEPAAAPVAWYRSLLPEFDVSVGGFIRTEAAFSTGGANPNNQNGNPFDKMSVQRTAYLPPTSTATVVGNLNGLLGSVVSTLGPQGTWATLPLALGTVPLGPNTAGTVTRPVEYTHDIFNMHILRGEVEVGMKLTSDLKVIGRLRGIYDPGHYHDFDARTVNNIYGGITGGDRALYGGRPDYFDYRVEGNSHPNPLEWDGKNYELYFPTLVLDYNHGPLNVRLGNQQIAWGQAIFFRVLDVPDGLDLRRHSLLDYAQEEFSDKRVPALAARVGYQFTDSMLADGYVQKFQPTIYGNPNTQYNIINSYSRRNVFMWC